MSSALAVTAFSLLCPWLALVRLLQTLAGGVIRRRGAARLAILGVAAIGLLATPVYGFTIAGWIRGVEANFSIPFTALLAAAMLEHEFAATPLTTTEKLTGWVFGLVAGLLLYPLALGLGTFDPYAWGWRFSPLFAASAALTVLFIWKRNRFGIVLLLASLVFNLGLLESNNYWDYLVDPVYVAAGIVILVPRFISGALRRASRDHGTTGLRDRRPPSHGFVGK